MEFIDNEKPGYYWSGFTEDFKKYHNVELSFPPVKIKTHDMQACGWRMSFRQKTRHSRLYLHFNNQKNFGFRVRLPASNYIAIDDFFWNLHAVDFDNKSAYAMESSQMAVTNVRNVVISVKEHMTIEESLQKEQERIKSALDGYRGEVRTLPDNVVDIDDYLKEPRSYVPSEVTLDSLVRALA